MGRAIRVEEPKKRDAFAEDRSKRNVPEKVYEGARDDIFEVFVGNVGFDAT